MTLGREERGSLCQLHEEKEHMQKEQELDGEF